MRLPTGSSLADSTSCRSPVRYDVQAPSEDSGYDNGIVNKQVLAERFCMNLIR